MKDDSIDFSEISTKRLPLRIVLFVVALAVAVGAFTIGVKKLGGNEAGYATVSARADGDAPLYAANFRLTYNFDGGSRAIRVQKNELSDAYSDALARLYKLLDAEKEYPGYEGSLAELNRRPNQDVALPQELFDILCDALERTERGEGYSVYDAPLRTEWNRIAYAADAEDFDPLHDADEAERLRAVAAQCADRGNCRLEIVDADQRIVRLIVSESYLDFLREYELPRIMLDLGQMKDAYLLRGVAEALNQRGFADGFLNTLGGLTVSLPGKIEGQYVIYSYVNKRGEAAAEIPIAPGSASAAFNAFPTTQDAGYYTADGHTRCASRPEITGEEAPIRSAFVLRRDGDIVEAAWEALRCFLWTDVPECAETAGDLLVYSLADDDGMSLYAFGKEREQIVQKDGFRLIFVDGIINETM
ncbi:MAG: FAD:protein FMN transferase [Clostridia bacterium]|nr:FAD:protein FMN transferase [Clostridia bacterium]